MIVRFYNRNFAKFWPKNNYPKQLHSIYPDIKFANVPLDEFVWENLNKWEDKTAVICSETKRGYKYGELYKKTNALTNFLHKHEKVKQSDVISIALPNVPEYPIIALGAIQRGLVVTTMNPFYTTDEICTQLINSKPKIIFTLNDIYPKIQKALSMAKQEASIVTIKTRVDELLPSEVIDFNSILQDDTKLNFKIERNLNDTIFLLYSSGTTGIPKGVELTHKSVVANLQQMESPQICLLTPGDLKQEVLPMILPPYHCYGLILNLLHGLRYGSKLVGLPKFQSELFFKMLIEHKPSVMQIVPPIFLLLTNSSFNTKDHLVNLKTITCGAAPLATTDIIKFQEQSGHKVNFLQGYGLTEASSATHIQSPYTENGIIVGGIGHLIPSTEGRIVSTETGITLSANQPGEIQIRGPQVMKGYYNNPEATRNAMAGDWLRTGDIGYYDDNGHFFITGRFKELIKVKSYQVAPAELEAVLRSHPDVEEAAVIGVPHEKFGETPKAFVVLKPNVRTKTTDIQDFVSKKVSDFKHLHGGVVFIETIPKSPSGKILHRVLKEL